MAEALGRSEASKAAELKGVDQFDLVDISIDAVKLWTPSVLIQYVCASYAD